MTVPGLPVLGEMVTDDLWWRYPSACLAGEGIAHLRVWAASGGQRGHLAVVTETGLGASVTNSIEDIWEVLARADPGPLTLVEHYPAAESLPGAGEHLDLVHVSNRRPQWRRVWPTPPASPAHAAFNAGRTLVSHTRDLWTRRTADGRRIPTARHGHGKRWLAVWTGPDGKRHSRALARRSDAAQYADAMQADALMQRELAELPREEA